uniref:RE1-silencing transcription factor n=1 Tax=Cacopsylla melanoneura TaxID=428564 RepID=A0A8D8YHI2_9HEMI
MYDYYLSDSLICQNCNKELLPDFNFVIEHCKLCDYVPRPDKSYYYVCFKCDYHNLKRNHMKRHVRIHLGVKPFKCDLCCYSSNELGNLNKHKRIRHDFEG